MGKNPNLNDEYDDRDMTVTLYLEDGEVNCSIQTIFECNGNDYIVLVPIGEDNAPVDDDTFWIYGYSENPDDSNEEPVLRYISDDEEYELVEDRYYELCDDQYFDELPD